MKRTFIFILSIMFLAMASCSDDAPAPANRDDDDTEDPIEGGISGDMSEIDFQAGDTYVVTGDLTVPDGTSVTIPAGVRLEFELGPRNEAWNIEVYGSLYVEGTEDNRVVFTATENSLNSSRNNGYGGLWGGIIGTSSAEDLVIEYADILHGGGITRSGTAITSPATGGRGNLSAGDRGYVLFYCRPDGERQDGVFILTHSRIAFTLDDALRTNGGKTLLTYNVFEVTGQNGGEAVNIKAGGSGDYAFNLFYNIATNGLKSADTQEGVEGSLNTNFYNNTIINSGYRRSEAARGGSLNYEANAYGKAYNNIMVNNRFGMRLTPGEDRPNTDRLEFGYNWYYGIAEEVVANFYPVEGPSLGLIGTELPIPDTDVIGGVGENDPLFSNYDVTVFSYAQRANNNPIPEGADFHLQASSPAASGGFTGFQPVFDEYVTAKGTTFHAPAPASYFGAFPVAGN